MAAIDANRCEATTSDPSTSASEGGPTITHARDSGPTPPWLLPQDPSLPLPDGASPLLAMPGEMVQAIARFVDLSALKALRSTGKPVLAMLPLPTASLEAQQARAEGLLARLPPNASAEPPADVGMVEFGLARICGSSTPEDPPAWITHAFGGWLQKVAQRPLAFPGAFDIANRLRPYVRPDLAARLLVDIVRDNMIEAGRCAVLHDLLDTVSGRAPLVNGRDLVADDGKVVAGFVPRLEAFVAEMQAKPREHRVVSLLLLCHLVPAAAHPARSNARDPGASQGSSWVASVWNAPPPKAGVNVEVHRLMKLVCENVALLPDELKAPLSKPLQDALAHLGRYEGVRQLWEARVNEVSPPA